MHVAVVILNWNGWKDTLQCLESLRHVKGISHTIVVDNNSSDESIRMLHAAFPNVMVIENQENLGYAGGNNVGIRYALDYGADFVWILNNDIIVDPNALEPLVQEFQDFNVGIVGSKIYYEQTPKIIWFAGGEVNWKKGYSYHLGQDDTDIGQYDNIHESQTANGASMLVSRTLFEKIGLFDDRYFLYFEETDLCIRAKKAGFKIRFAPQSKIWHKISRSTGINSQTFLYYYTRNNIFFVKKHRGPIHLLISLPYLLVRSYYNLAWKDTPQEERKNRLQIWYSAWFDGIMGRYGKKVFNS